MNNIIYYYLSWSNEFISIDRYAEYHGLDVSDARILIEMGRKYNDRLSELDKIYLMSYGEN